MTALPEPTLSFTLPSLHDSLLLSCRIYLPQSHLLASHATTVRGAILAHPYAPLGGCFDDPVVGIVGSEILRHGWLLLTFNFRGAGDSQGRTSWTGRAEGRDYASVVGFLVQYLHGLEIVSDGEEHGEEESREGEQGKKGIHVVLGGYSYGSMIASKLPLLPVLLAPFGQAESDSAAAEISLRAEHLAAQTNEELAEERELRRLAAQDPSSARRTHGHTLTVGGNESPQRDAHQRSRSRDMRQSLDRVTRRIHVRKQPERQARVEGVVARRFDYPVHVAYLLISPVLAPALNLIAMPAWHGADADAGTKFEMSPTLAVYGSEDMISSAKKVTTWTAGLAALNPDFRGVQVEPAGHFWREKGVAYQLVREVGNWLDCLIEKR